MSRRRRLDGEMHLAFGICHACLKLALFCDGSKGSIHQLDRGIQ
jgi:hypothetical protein